jgi:transcriptional regulator with XRE-family HTH domain
VVTNLRVHRNALGISQSRLARQSGVSRYKICLFELGDGSLTAEEQDRIRTALELEAHRLRNVPASIAYLGSVRMNDDRLTESLAVRVMGWRTAPGRYLKSGRAWTPGWRFAPLTSVEDAFGLLAAAASTYTLCTGESGIFEAEVRVGGRVGKASGEPKARAITLALVRALGLDINREPNSLGSAPQRRNRQPSRSNGDA